MRDLLTRRILAISLITLISCSPVVKSITYEKSAVPLNRNEEVLVLSLNQSLPDSTEFIGKIRVNDSGFSTDCSYDAVIAYAKVEARKIGGNIIKIIEIKPPSFSSTCYRLNADIFLTKNLENTKNALNSKDNHRNLNDSTNFKYAIVHIFRPKNFTGSAVSYNVHVGDTLIRNVKNNSKFSIKIYKEGNLEVWAKTESLETVTIPVKFGEEYYLRCGVRVGIWIGIPEINFLERSQGKKELLNMENNRKRN